MTTPEPTTARPLSAASASRSRRLRSMLFTAPVWPADHACNGVATYVGLQAAALRKRGVDVSIYARELRGDAAEGVYGFEQMRAQRSTVRRVIDRLAYRWSEAAWFRHGESGPLALAIGRAVRDRGVQVVETEEVWGPAYRLAGRCAVPIGVRLHGPWFLVGEALGLPRTRAFEQRVAAEGRGLEMAAGVSAPSEYALQRVRQHYGLELPRAAVIPNPVAPVAAEQRWTLASSDPGMILFVGRFDRCKGGDVLLEAFARVGAQHREARLVWVGPDSGLHDERGRVWKLAEYARHVIADASIRARVEHLGPRTPAQIAELRRRARLTVVCSRFETFGMVVVEAMAHGSPLVAADAGGVGEIVEHDRTGVLCELANAEALAGAMLRLLGDEQMCQRLGGAAAEAVAQRYDPMKLADRVMAHYERVIGG